MLPFSKTVYKKISTVFSWNYKLSLKIYLSAKCQHGQDTLKNSKKVDISNIKTYYEAMLIKMM